MARYLYLLSHLDRAKPLAHKKAVLALASLVSIVSGQSMNAQPVDESMLSLTLALNNIPYEQNGELLVLLFHGEEDWLDSKQTAATIRHDVEPSKWI